MRCHTSQGIHAPMVDHGSPMEMSCSSCHRPHARPGATLVPCTGCHLAAGVAKAGGHGGRGHARCVDCHPPHTWIATNESCDRCHPTARAHAKGQVCLVCHSFAGVPLPATAPEPP
jgi:hypothetical protein